MPIFDYQISGPVGGTKIDRTVDIPVGGATNSLDVILTALQPSPQVVVVRRNRFGVQRGTKEIRLAMKSRVAGASAAGVVMDLGSVMSDRVRTTDIRNRNGYTLEMDANDEDKILLKKGMLVDSEIMFTGTGLTTDFVTPRVGPGNWIHVMMQLELLDTGVANLKVRKSSDPVNAVSPTWARITGLPDLSLGRFDVRSPGWIGVYGRGTTGSLARFNTISLTDQITVL